ncbi:hypothetical protein C8Q74DRAFT_1197654 [Fomes fomentarius]|nr:hypothetical protein C8Q74DRAFT_1197654 [Fomes fomentarius]
MAPPKRASCQVCDSLESKYTCAKCTVVYCSVPCYKSHQGGSPLADSEQQDPPLRPLASLRWPYVPEESAYPDPLKRDDPKPLQVPQYEAIATSPSIRRVLGTNPRLRDILRSIDALRGEDRELALQEALGVGGARNHALADLGHAAPEDRDTLRQLAEAVEAAVRGGKQDALGLDWGD